MIELALFLVPFVVEAQNPSIDLSIDATALLHDVSGKWRQVEIVRNPLGSVPRLFATQPVEGQTLPSAYYLRDDVQYFPAGPEFERANRVQGGDGMNNRRERDPAPWWQEHFMSEKARSIERELGIAGADE